MIDWRILSQKPPGRPNIRRTNKRNTFCKLSTINKQFRSFEFPITLQHWWGIDKFSWNLYYQHAQLKDQDLQPAVGCKSHVSSSIKREGNSNKKPEERNNVVWYLHQEINSFRFSIVLYGKCKKVRNRKLCKVRTRIVLLQ